MKHALRIVFCLVTFMLYASVICQNSTNEISDGTEDGHQTDGFTKTIIDSLVFGDLMNQPDFDNEGVIIEDLENKPQNTDFLFEQDQQTSKCVNY